MIMDKNIRSKMVGDSWIALCTELEPDSTMSGSEIANLKSAFESTAERLIDVVLKAVANHA